TWRASMRHGRGCETIKNISKYKGYYVNNFKCGKGELDFIKRSKEEVESLKSKIRDMKTVPEYRKRYHGYFISDNITSGGILMDTIVLNPFAVAKRDTTQSATFQAYTKKCHERAQ